MINNNIVNRIALHSKLSMKGLYKDYIYGKYTAHLYYQNLVHKIEVLEWVHIDIWGLLPTISAGGCIYFIVIMNRFSSYRTVAFLKSKSANTILSVFKAYQVEAEQQTGKKLKSV